MIKKLTEEERKEALVDLEMYFGKPPYNVVELKNHQVFLKCKHYQNMVLHRWS